MNEQASEMFMDLVCDQGTPSADCELCGRTHFASGQGSCYDVEEIERCQRAADKEPEKWCEHHEDGISFGFIDGKQVVFDCPCNKLRRYEDFIWRHRDLIVSYLQRRGEAELKEAAGFVDSMKSM